MKGDGADASSTPVEEKRDVVVVEYTDITATWLLWLVGAVNADANASSTAVPKVSRSNFIVLFC